MLHPGEDQDPGLGEGVLQGQPGVFDHPAGERLHGKHADVLLARFRDDRFPGLGLEEAEADHDHVEQAVIEGAVQHLQVVTGDPDVTDQPFVPGLAQGLQRSSGGDDSLVVGVVLTKWHL